MKRLQKLKRVNSYLAGFLLAGYPDIVPARVVNAENATGLLSKAAGDQILIALPECRDSGQSSDEYTEYISSAFFVLAKVNGPARTQATADAAYQRLLEIAQDIVKKLEEDLTIPANGSPCPLLAGLSLTDVSVTPEYSLFGGWSGWSVEITLG